MESLKFLLIIEIGWMLRIITLEAQLLLAEVLSLSMEALLMSNLYVYAIAL